ncbi:uncharacterized protein LOC124447695 [Xenia sp. Carnegie-2017]|uniref:uncharacterized protein LOC124447695 n=1 Tax=Xenia sp. Carnegie-2017 TaxID=2897299 RepID=UPI001F04568A|nr:uncharacterized protein LOC124447695 [Xenia sp. Carnegie-2017]XP_046854628.1 uncharacterized protein LOC124447695 [Xenia sp. Carnegie-2017]XP_046854629.1 uncharacterized protein LOC124447695 [Xenia sp. Carnegie-2017]
MADWIKWYFSKNKGTIVASLKSLSFLRCPEEEIGKTLGKFIETTDDPRILYEAGRALILTGNWHPSAITIIYNVLKNGSKRLKEEILNDLFTVENIPFFEKSEELPYQNILMILEKLVEDEDEDENLAFLSSLCLGKLFVLHPLAKNHLIKVIKKNTLNPAQKTQVFDLLVRQMNCKDISIVESLFHELNTSIDWKVRVQACDLLMFIGNRHVLVKDANEIFEVLQRLLWDHPYQEVRSKVAELLTTLEMRKRGCSLVLRRLEDSRETVRARAVISMATLEMKGEKELKALLDILVLDSSVYTKIQVVRLFSHMNWNDVRILRSLKERERGEGILAKEAKKALENLT